MIDSGIAGILIVVAFFAGLGLGNINAGMLIEHDIKSGEVTIQVDHAPDIIYTCEIRGNSDD